MANKYANLVGTNKIKDEYSKINTGFDKVEADINNTNSRITAVSNRVDTIITTPIDGEAAAQEIVDARAGFSTIGGRITAIEEDIVTHMADKMAHGGIYRKNLLHNWDFRNPVNQRGRISYTTYNQQYTIDRWMQGWQPSSASNTISIENGYLSLKNTETNSRDSLFQYIENIDLLVGKTVTLSVLLPDGKILSKQDTVSKPMDRTSGRVYIYDADGVTVLGFVQLYSPNADTKPYVRINVAAGKTLNLCAIKLELGSESTLVNDPPADFGEQLALCQRYALVLDTGSYSFRASAYDNDTITFIIPTPVTMRINPTFVGTLTVMSAGVAQTGFTFSIYRNAVSLAVVASKSAHGLTDAWLNVSNNTLFSADL